MTRNAQNSQQGVPSPDESLTPEQMQRIIQVGEEASQLLGSQVYNMAYQQLLHRKFQEFLTSDPKEERRRESLYLQAKGLVEMTELLAESVADAQRALQSQQENTNPDAQQQAYMDQQGFGLNYQ